MTSKDYSSKKMKMRCLGDWCVFVGCFLVFGVFVACVSVKAGAKKTCWFNELYLVDLGS